MLSETVRQKKTGVLTLAGQCFKKRDETSTLWRTFQQSHCSEVVQRVKQGNSLYLLWLETGCACVRVCARSGIKILKTGKRVIHSHLIFLMSLFLHHVFK